MLEGIVRLGFLVAMIVASAIIGYALGTNPLAWFVSSLLIAVGIRAIV